MGEEIFMQKEVLW